ncbi:unnamed protein product [Urochloa decumbens]|uniref:F-box/LRR-repeat protein 15/At3g58940/PEG3-like LRR domain-containing protein n=1 Tax=Urochloa decumbens TaxID=240449 RepID=A0ABC9FWV8_9POAL
MGTDDGDLVAAAGEDRISGLPDHLLHSILLGHPDLRTFDAARTSVLSRRWRHVWAHLPFLSFSHGGEEADSSTLDRIDAALNAYSDSEPTASRLEISMTNWRCQVPVSRVASWLRFASRRLAGELRLSLCCGNLKYGEVAVAGEELVIPLCERATEISFEKLCCALRFRLPPADAGAFAALITLDIKNAALDGEELDGVLASRCPRLKKLVLEWITVLGGGDASVLSIRSGSLEDLKVSTNERLGRLQVAAPELRTLFLSIRHGDAHIAAAPKLEEVYCYNNYGFEPGRHRLVEAGRHLRRLVIMLNAAVLMRQFNTVDELVLGVYIPKVRHRRYYKQS